jgi:DNA repair protein RecO (recombination protein O)
MSVIVKTEAVVLHSRKYRESSKMLTLYTREFGKMTALLKGVRRTSAKYPKAIDPLSHIVVVLYNKESREIQTISQCDLVNTFPHIAKDLDKLSVAMMMIELTHRSTQGHEKNIQLFTLLTTALKSLNHATKNYKSLLYAFEIGLAGSLGYHPTFDRCISCGKLVPAIESDVNVEYHLDKGGPLCSRCTTIQHGYTVTVRLPTLKTLQRLREAGMNGVTEIGMREELQQEIETLLWLYLRYHVSGIGLLKSKKVFAEIMTKI